jgi:hypothetical protein
MQDTVMTAAGIVELGGGGGGYGESGIGGNAGGRSNTGYNDTSYGGDSGGGFSGRYSDDSATRSTPSSSAVPTFATLPDDPPQKKAIKKKKKKVPQQAEAPAPAAPGEYKYPHRCLLVRFFTTNRCLTRCF